MDNLAAWDEIKISRSSGLTTKGSKEMREFFSLQVLEPPHILFFSFTLTNRLALSYSLSEERKAFPVSFQECVCVFRIYVSVYQKS